MICCCGSLFVLQTLSPGSTCSKEKSSDIDKNCLSPPASLLIRGFYMSHPADSRARTEFAHKARKNANTLLHSCFKRVVGELVCSESAGSRISTQLDSKPKPRGGSSMWARHSPADEGNQASSALNRASRGLQGLGKVSMFQRS